jgi:hypothetical protein
MIVRGRLMRQLGKSGAQRKKARAILGEFTSIEAHFDPLAGRPSLMGFFRIINEQAH